MTRRRSRLCVILGAATIFISAGLYGCAQWGTGDRAVAKPGPVVFATGSPGGVYHQYGQALATVGAKQLGPTRILETMGSVQNLNLLASGEATFGFTAADAAVGAYHGEGIFTTAVPLRAVARLYDDYTHLVTYAESSIHVVGDLRGHRVSVGGTGSGTALIADRILAGALMDPRRDIIRSQLGLADAIAALQAGDIDAFFWSGGLPTSAVADLARATNVRLVDLAEPAASLRSRYGSQYRAASIATGTYPGMSTAVTTVAVPNLLVTTASTSDSVVDRLVRALFDSAPAIAARIPAVGQIDARAAIFTGAIPLHDGARDYYRAAKVPI